MYIIGDQSGDVTYNSITAYVNETTDIATLPTDWALGSKALVIWTSDVYILTIVNNVRVWKKLGGGGN